MAFQVSPGINTSEIDLTTVIPSISTSVGAVGGVFSWGPVGKITLVDSENTLVARYGKPNSNNYETFFSAANFLSYSNALYVSRAAVTTGTSLAFTENLRGDTYVLSSNTITGITVGLGVYGVGIPAGATVSALSNTAESDTFNGNTNVETIGFINLGTNLFVNGEQVTYTTSAGNTAITGLANNTNYFVVSSNASGVFLATSYGGSNIGLTKGVTESGHNLNSVARTKITLSANATLGTSGTQSSQYLQFFTATMSFNSGANTSNANRSSYIVKNSDHYDTVTVPSGVEYVARYPGALGNTLKISVCDTAAQYSSNITASAGYAFTVNSNTGKLLFDGSANATNNAAILTVGDYIEVGNSTISKQNLKIASKTANGSNIDLTFTTTFNLSSNYTSSASSTVTRKWEYYNQVDRAPGTSQSVIDAGGSVVDQLSIVIADEDGNISGTPGAVLEIYQNVSRATDSKNSDGTTNYYKDVITSVSKYVWQGNDRSGAASGNTSTVIASTATTPYTASFTGGFDGTTETSVTNGALATAYDLFADPTTADISLLIAGKSLGGTHGEQHPNYLIDNIAETRKDCVVFLSPQYADVAGSGVEGNQATNIITFRNSVRNSSYAVIDSGYKYQYDKYNDVYRWIPLNGDIAGISARTDSIRDPWFSPAGFVRGQIKNIVKLAYNPSKVDRDELYKKDINPVSTFPGQGTILFGDKTALGRPSAFDRINVRRLFITLEKAIANASNSTLFEFNDEFTRAQFRNLVEPFLRDVQGRRGIYDFRVVCDETNNTTEIIDSNRFVGDIYIKPAKSINFIQLNFVAVRSGVEFNEVVGQF